AGPAPRAAALAFSSYRSFPAAIEMARRLAEAPRPPGYPYHGRRSRGKSRLTSPEQRLDWRALGDAVGPAVAVADFGVRRDAERGIVGGEDVLRRHRVVLDVGGLLGGGAVDLPPAVAAAGQKRRLAHAPVVAALRRVDLRRAADLPGHRHERLVEQAA